MGTPFGGVPGSWFVVPGLVAGGFPGWSQVAAEGDGDAGSGRRPSEPQTRNQERERRRRKLSGVAAEAALMFKDQLWYQYRTKVVLIQAKVEHIGGELALHRLQ